MTAPAGTPLAALWRQTASGRFSVMGAFEDRQFGAVEEVVALVGAQHAHAQGVICALGCRLRPEQRVLLRSELGSELLALGDFLAKRSLFLPSEVRGALAAFQDVFNGISAPVEIEHQYPRELTRSLDPGLALAEAHSTFTVAAASALRTFSSPKTGGDQMRILFLASNPRQSARLALGEEAKAIEDRLRSTEHRDGIVFKSEWAVTPDGLEDALLRERPTVVHFAGHGAGSPGIVFHGEDGRDEALLDAGVLGHLFQTLRDNIRVVVLNACYSEAQASALLQSIDCIVAMSDSIGDEAALKFSASFYRGLGYGRSVQTAFDLGINALKRAGLNDDEVVPVLRTRDGVDPSNVVLAGVAPNP